MKLAMEKAALEKAAMADEKPGSTSVSGSGSGPSSSGEGPVRMDMKAH